jgi:hypothetical protein
LGERLGAAAGLTLVSAPAGFGKTTLLTEWLAAGGRKAAWLSLDERDNDPASYWAYLIAALKTAAPDVGAASSSLLRSSQAPIEAVLSALLNDLDAVEYDVVLVLDDYHVIEACEIHDGMTFLVEHLPPQLQLVIASRVDPPLPLARMRARGELVEIRSAELRFTADEVAEYLNGAMGLALTASDVAALEGRTEGWIAALQLAALSMQGRDDVSGFIAGFAGDDRYIVDYLARRCCSASPRRSRTSCSGPPSSTASAGRSVMPSPGRTVARTGSPRSSAATSSSSRSTTSAGGTGITNSSPTSSKRTCSTSNPTSSASCTNAPVRGTRRTASAPRRSAIPLQQRISTERRH